MTRDLFSRRLRAYRWGEHVALAIGALPLLAIYVAVHTRWLKPLLQDHKHLMVALMIVLPLAWLLLAVSGWKRFGARWLGLKCRQCGHVLAEPALPPPGEALRCPACGTELSSGAPRTC
jgi:hypothetical protein